jgi:hypothetical protein
MQSPGGGPNVGANAPTNFPTYNGTPIVPVPGAEAAVFQDSPSNGQQATIEPPVAASDDRSQTEPLSGTNTPGAEEATATTTLRARPPEEDKIAEQADPGEWRSPPVDTDAAQYTVQLAGFNWNDLNPFNPGADYNPFSDNFCFFGHNDVGGCLGKGIFDEVLPEIFKTFISSLIFTAIIGLIVAGLFGVDGVVLGALGAAGIFRLLLELILKGVLKGFIANLWKRPLFWVWSNWHGIWGNRGNIWDFFKDL